MNRKTQRTNVKKIRLTKASTMKRKRKGVLGLNELYGTTGEQNKTKRIRVIIMITIFVSRCIGLLAVYCFCSTMDFALPLEKKCISGEYDCFAMF